MSDRLRFWWVLWRRPSSLFRYDTETGYGLGVSSYCPFTDEVLVRVSRFGLVEYEEWRSRDRFNSFGKPLDA